MPPRLTRAQAQATLDAIAAAAAKGFALPGAYVRGYKRRSALQEARRALGLGTSAFAHRLERIKKDFPGLLAAAELAPKAQPAPAFLIEAPSKDDIDASALIDSSDRGRSRARYP